LSASEVAEDPAATDIETPRPVAPVKGNFTRELVSVTAGRMIAKICQFLIGVVAARLIGPDGRGLIASFAVAPDLAVSFSQLGIREAVAYHIGRKTYDAGEIVPTLLGMAFTANLVAISACVAYYAATGLLNQPWILVVLALGPVPFMLLTSYAGGVFLGKMMIARFNRVNWIPMALNLVLVLVFGLVLKIGVAGIMLAAVVAAALNCAYGYYLLRSVTPLRIGFNREIASKLTRLGVVYATTVFMMLLNYRLPILLLHNLSSLEQVGIYAVAQTLALMIWEIPEVLSNLVFSRGVNAENKAAFSDKVVVLARLVVLAGVGVGIGCAIVGPIAIPLIFGEKFRESATILTILLPGTVAFMAFRVLNMDMAGRGHPWISIPVVVPCMAANAGLGLFFVPEYGAPAAATLTSASYILATLAYVVVYARFTRQPLRSILIYRASDFAAVLYRLRHLRHK